jgi:hypothetical protein
MLRSIWRSLPLKNKKRVEFEVVYLRHLSTRRLSMPMTTMATITAAMMPTNMAVLSGAACGAAVAGGVAVTPSLVSPHEL